MSKTHTAPKERASKNKLKINRKRLLASLLALAVLLSVTAFIGYAGSYDKVYPNTYIDGKKAGGLTYDSVKGIIEKNVKELDLPDTIKFSISGETFSVPISDIDLKPDTDGTAAAAMGNRQGKGLFSRFIDFTHSLIKKNEVHTAFLYDEKKLDKKISEFAAPYETAPVDASYEINGNKLTLRKGQPGKKISKKNLKKDITKYIKNPENAIALKLSKVNEKELDLDKFYKEITGEAKDAYYARNEAGNVIVVPDRPKITVEKDEIKKALASDKESVTLTVKTTPAGITRDALEKALFSGTMGSWTSRFNAGNRARSSNVALSASRINGIVLLPGETFSYDKAVGPRTTANGFQSAGVYINNKVEQGIGGGVCQTSSTLYSAVLYANLEIVSRTSHSLPVSYMPPGQDATIAEGSIDFKFRNNTDYPVKIVASVNGGSVTCSIVGTPVQGQKVVINNTTTAVYEPKTEIVTDPSVPVGYKKTTAGSKGSAVSSTRTVYQGGKAISTQKLTGSVYNSSPTVITVNPADKNTPPESLTEYSKETFSAPAEIPPAENDSPPSPEPSSEEVIEIQ